MVGLAETTLGQWTRRPRFVNILFFEVNSTALRQAQGRVQGRGRHCLEVGWFFHPAVVLDSRLRGSDEGEKRE